VAQRVAVLAEERRPVPRRHGPRAEDGGGGGGPEGARGEISTARRIGGGIAAVGARGESVLRWETLRQQGRKDGGELLMTGPKSGREGGRKSLRSARRSRRIWAAHAGH
jgi:hypothetical protein